MSSGRRGSLRTMRLSTTMFLTLDGVYQAPGGREEDTDDGFTHGGWLGPHFDMQFGEWIDGVFERADAFLLGRRTYEIFAGYWPNESEGNVAVKLNSLPKYVATSTLTDLDWEGAEVLQGDLAQAVNELKARDGGELQVHGSGALVNSLIAADLIDTYNIVRVPVIVGEGKRLFAGGGPAKALEVRSRETTSTGVSLEIYDVTGPAKTVDITELDI